MWLSVVHEAMIATVKIYCFRVTCRRRLLRILTHTIEFCAETRFCHLGEWDRLAVTNTEQDSNEKSHALPSCEAGLTDVKRVMNNKWNLFEINTLSDHPKCFSGKLCAWHRNPNKHFFQRLKRKQVEVVKVFHSLATATKQNPESFMKSSGQFEPKHSFGNGRHVATTELSDQCWVLTVHVLYLSCMVSINSC